MLRRCCMWMDIGQVTTVLWPSLPATSASRSFWTSLCCSKGASGRRTSFRARSEPAFSSVPWAPWLVRTLRTFDPAFWSPTLTLASTGSGSFWMENGTTPSLTTGCQSISTAGCCLPRATITRKCGSHCSRRRSASCTPATRCAMAVFLVRPFQPSSAERWVCSKSGRKRGTSPWPPMFTLRLCEMRREVVGCFPRPSQSPKSQEEKQDKGNVERASQTMDWSTAMFTLYCGSWKPAATSWSAAAIRGVRASGRASGQMRTHSVSGHTR
mmetsp:Transcript_52498/g.94614  ORF Transcript_52498/g.94614 Transcript_52498/m.94614 type:complete len:269 (+) Transcript_52498:261-1067(+)